MFGDITPLLDRITLEFSDPREGREIQEWYERLHQQLLEGKADVQRADGKDEHMLTTYGLSFRMSEDPNKGSIHLRIHVDPLLTKPTFALLDRVLPSLRQPTLNACDLTLQFNDDVQELDDKNKVTARIYGTGITLSASGGYDFAGLSFSMSHGYRGGFGGGMRSMTRAGTTLALKKVPFPLSAARTAELISILVERSVLRLQTQEMWE
jgi:hypothetical protein